MDSIYESLTELEKTGLTLRDFFNSHDSRSLKSAYVRLNPTAAVNLTDRAWLEAEYDFIMRYSSVLASCWLRLSLQCIWRTMRW